MSGKPQAAAVQGNRWDAGDPDPQGEMARRAALGGAETDQQLQILGILSKALENRVDVGGLGPALAAEPGGHQFRCEHQGHDAERIRTTRVSEANHELSLWLDEPGLTRKVAYG